MLTHSAAEIRSMRNCRIKSYSQKLGLFAKPDNCLIDKVE